MNIKDIKTKKYPSSELLLPLALDLYNEETQRKQSLDTKSGIMLALAYTILGVLLTLLSNGIMAGLFGVILLILESITVLFLMVSLGTYKYDTLPLDVLVEDKIHLMEPSDLSRVIAEVLKEKIKHNRKKNNFKSRLYFCSMCSQAFVFLGFVLCFCVGILS